MTPAACFALGPLLQLRPPAASSDYVENVDGEVQHRMTFGGSHHVEGGRR